MNNVLETNVLIIGKSGVGKSSLINYIFDKQLMKTGSGRPITEKGVFTEKLKIDDRFTINLSDTWGIEANKAEEWEKIIIDEVKKHDCGGISDWFHTIFYCISAKSARIEDFEKKIIEKLMKARNKVIVVLTHADTNNVEKAIINMTKELINIGIEESDIIKVCSVRKKLLGVRITKAFGRNDLLNCIKCNLWETICTKLSIAMDKIIEENIDKWYELSYKYIEEELKWYNNRSNKKLGEIAVKIEEYFSNSTSKIELELTELYKEAYNYYFNMVKKYNSISINKMKGFEYKCNINFEIDMKERIGEWITQFILSLIPLLGFFVPAMNTNYRKEDMVEQLKQIKIDIIRKLKNNKNNKIKEMQQML